MTHDTDYKGRIFGKNVLEATFRAFHGTDLFLGELLVAEDPERVRRFLFRVVQVTYGSDSSDPGWAERTAGAFMSGDAAGTPYTLRDPEQRLHKVATCAPLGYIDPAGEFRKPKSLPAQFAKVTAPSAEDFAFLRERMGDLRIGQLRSGEDTIDLEVGIRGDTLTSHVGVFATTGMGKSNLMKVLAGQILASQGRYAVLLFDPHGEYHEGGVGTRRGLRDHPWAVDRLKVYATRAAGAGATSLRLSLSARIVDELSNGYSVLVETSGLSSMEEILVASAITRRLLDTYSQTYLEDRDRFAALPPVLVALEEAQRVLSRVKRSDENVFPSVAREGRKFTVGMCAVSQQPKLIDDELLSQFNTFFILGLADEKDRNILRGSSKQDISDLGPEIQTLMPGESIVTNLEAPFALPAQVYLYEEYLKSVKGPSPLPARPENAARGFAD